jgi:HD-like signal output (HDOD) protein
MKPRCLLPASEVEALWSRLERQIDGVGLPTQPEVAGHVLALVSDANAGIRQYAEVIRADAPLSGRLLRFANSAYFAQRQPVTNLERACVLLGIERLKAISLGFFLSRGAASDPSQALSRRVWGESVFRACLSCEIARVLTPAYSAEAFVIGLMLDAGVPLMLQLHGTTYAALLEECPTPHQLFEAEFRTLPFTHVDLVSAMARRWRLPELLARPLQRHHTTPRMSGRENSIQTLHRIAFYAGALHLSDIESPIVTEAPTGVGARVLGLASETLTQIIERATREYSAMYDVFREVADSIGGLTEVALRVHQQLLAVTDEVILEQLRKPGTTSGKFSIGGQRIEIEIDGNGRAVAYLSDAKGSRLLSYSFRAGEDSVARILEGLGLETSQPQEAEDLDIYLRSMAA